jgi:hypothetical protein
MVILSDDCHPERSEGPLTPAAESRYAPPLNGVLPNARFTFAPVRTYYVCILASASRVLYVGVTSDLEKRIKGLLPRKKIALIECQNPGWRDLAEELWPA